MIHLSPLFWWFIPYFLTWIIFVSPSPPSSCVRWLPSCCITSSCPRLPGCSWRACISTACRPSSATSTLVPWGSTTPSAGACQPLSRVTHTCRHVRSLWCLSQTCLSIQVYTQSNVLLHANALSYACVHTHTHIHSGSGRVDKVSYLGSH